MSFSVGAKPERVKAIVRTDIQALRAVAILSVVIFHLWPNRLTGGFVGVDVFFVISGFLITQHLLRDVASESFSVVTFWAKRIRRLLPASITVLIFTALGIWLLAPQQLWPNWISEVGSSAAYFENWTLAINSVDYLAADNAASPTQHFWSLSVEEQFYFVLPIIILLVTLILRRRSVSAKTKTVGAILAAIVIVGFFVSLKLSYSEPVSAYFYTHVRAWQFASGALLAAIWSRVPSVKMFKRLSLVTGLVLIAASMIWLQASFTYPGFWAVVPTFGAVLVLASNLEAGFLSRVLAWRPIQFIGDISYSVYLWHWPLIILLPYALGTLTTSAKLFIVALSVGLGWLSRKYIEIPFMRPARSNKPRTARTIITMAAVCSLLLGGSIAGASAANDSIKVEINRQTELVKSGLDCLGAASRAPNGEVCTNRDLDEILIPTPGLASKDNPSLLFPDNCQGTRPSDAIPKPCNLTGKISDIKIALVGDSHSAQYIAPMAQLAEQNNWQVVSYSKGGCPLSYAKRDHDQVLFEACKTWVDEIVTDLTTEGFDLLVTSQVSGVIWQNGSEPVKEYAENGLAALWGKLNQAGVPVIAIKDIPRPIKDALLCIETNSPNNYDACANSAEKGFLFDPQPGAVAHLASPLTKLLDFSSVYCKDLKCSAVLGGVVVNRDSNHLTNTFSRTLAPYIRAEIVQTLGLAG